MINAEESLRRGASPETIRQLQEKEASIADAKKLQKIDPVKKQSEKGLEDTEHSPMDPPSAYEQPGKIEMEKMNIPLQILAEDHKKVLRQVDEFEKYLLEFKLSGYKVNQKINEVFGSFFKFFDEDLLPHNDKEEKVLFPILRRKLIEAGEHSKGETKVTAIDIMEDDHVKFIQLGTLTFNFLGLATRLRDESSKIFVLDTAYENARELIELLKLHVYREDHTLFPLAQKYLSMEEFENMEREMNQH